MTFEPGKILTAADLNAALANYVPIAALAATASGQGGSLVGLPTGDTVQQFIAKLMGPNGAGIIGASGGGSVQAYFNMLMTSAGAAAIGYGSGTVKAALDATSISIGDLGSRASFLSTYPSVLPNEVLQITGGGGTGGTPGTYVGGTTGAFAGFTWSVFVGSDGKAVPRIDTPGISTSSTAPTLVMPSIPGLTGATTPIAVVGTIPVNRFFMSPSADGMQRVGWINSAGSLNPYLMAGQQYAEYVKGGIDAFVAGQNSLQRSLGQFAQYPGTDVLPLAMGINGNCPLYIDLTTGYVVAYFSPTDPILAGIIARNIPTNFAGYPGTDVTPLAMGINGVAPIWIDNADGYVKGNFQPRKSAVPVYATMQAFGDSFTVGNNASPLTAGFAYQVTTAYGATITNSGVGGTVLSNQNDGGGVLSNNGRDRFAATLLGANLKEALTLAYGFNDARRPTFTASEYQTDLNEVVSACIIGGYQRTAITLCSPWWITDTGLTTGTTGFTGQTRSGFEAFVTAARQVAYDLGVHYFDAYAYMRDNGGSALISSDNIHPTNDGHTAIAVGLVNEARLINRRSPVTGITQTAGTGTLATTCDAVLGASSYDFQYCFGTASYVWSVSNNQASPAASWSGLAAGTYRVRARARFADGGYSPWAFANITVSVS